MTSQNELKKGSTQTLILAVLQTGALHGYAIAREIEARSKEALSMGEGALYPALRQLEREGFIEGSWEIQPNGPARKVYTLTESGKAELAKRTKTWFDFSDAVNSILGGKLHGQTS